MFLKINNVVLDNKVHKFCMDYVQNNTHDHAYDGNNFLEYYPSKESFIRNFNFVDICIGRMSTGKVTSHVDEFRDSVLIIPIFPNDLTLITHSKDIIASPFLLNTSLKHSAESIPNAVFIGVDFHKTFDEALEYINSIDTLFLGAL